jgi:hypothetical protein
MIDSHDFNRMARKACSECGSPQIEWTSLGAVAEGPEPYRTPAQELLPVLGASAEAWICRNCDGFGAFEQTLHTGGF